MCKWLSNKLPEIIDYIVEPILFGFGIFIIFPHWQTIYNSIPHDNKFVFPTLSELGKALWANMTSYPTPYIWFFVIFVVWIVLKRINKRSDNKINERLIKLIENNTKVLERIEIILSKLDKEEYNGK